MKFQRKPTKLMSESTIRDSEDFLFEFENYLYYLDGLTTGKHKCFCRRKIKHYQKVEVLKTTEFQDYLKKYLRYINSELNITSK